MLSDTFAGIAPSSVLGFVAMQLVGGLAGYVLVRALFPHVAAALPTPSAISRERSS
jgi:arsenate reductase